MIEKAHEKLRVNAPRKPAHRKRTPERKPECIPEHKPEEHHKPEPVKWTLKVLKQKAKEKGIKKYSKMNKELTRLL